MPQTESLALPLREAKHAPVARFRVLLLAVSKRQYVSVCFVFGSTRWTL